MAKKAAKKAASAPKVETKKPSFEVVKRLAEVGEVYKPGDKIQLTKKRAEALGDLVKPASE